MIDTGSETWGLVDKWAKDAMATLFQELAKPGLEHRRGDEIRGALVKLDELRKLPKPKAPLSEPSESRNKAGY